MLKIVIDNTPVYTPANTTLLEACEKLGVYVPRFCYHERLRVAGNCRMCLLEVEKAPKPVVSCAFPINNGMNVFTSSPLVRKARENVIEFLLINHPYDCPVCDQGGECDLQEQTLKYGSDRSRFRELKRTVEDKNVGPIIKTIMTRCIHCTRCVRFLELVTGTEEFGTTTRGKDTEIGTYIGKTLSTELSGNLIDLCPVGALTSKPYAFSARPWELKNRTTIDVSDAIGSHITVSVKEATIVRVAPLMCDEINGEWISDKTRFYFDGLNSQRLGDSYFKSEKGSVDQLTWKNVINLLKNKLKDLSLPQEEILIVAGNNVDIDSYYFLQVLNKKYKINIINEETYSNFSSTFSEDYKMNIPLSKMDKSDFILGFNINPRFEGALFNVRLRQNFIQGTTKFHFLGLPENLSFNHKNWDNTLKTLIEIGEGRHPICSQLTLANFPMILHGTSKLPESGNQNYLKIFNEIAKHTNLVQDQWNGINFLPTTPNFVGKINSANISQGLDFKKVKLLFLCQLDNPNNFYKKVDSDCLKVLATPIVLEKFFSPNTLLIPITTNFETKADFVNLEGRKQTTRVVTASNFSNARSLESVCKLFAHLIQKESVETTFKKLKKQNFSNFSSDFENLDFVIYNNLTKKKNIYKKDMNQFTEKLIAKAPVLNFFKTSLASENSVVMSDCSSQFFSNFSNFHFYDKKN